MAIGEPFYQVCEDQQDVQTVPISQRFDTKTEADTALAGLAEQHPTARVWQFQQF